MRMKKISENQVKGLVGSTDWNRVKSLTEDEIKLAATTDPTAKELKPQELQQFKRKSPLK